MYIKSTILATTFALGALSAPVSQPGLTADQLIAIAPATASCSGTDFPAECTDATKAAPALNSAFAKYGITSPGEQVAIIAYTLFESGNYKYSKNHYPGRPGQGTRMMAMPPYVKKYAAAIAGDQAVATAEAAGGNAGLDAVLALANADDEKSFGSAAWFLTTQCTPQIRAGLVSEETAGWHSFLTECVGTTAAPERDTPWLAAKQIINGAGVKC